MSVIKELTVEKLHARVFSTRAEMGEHAAREASAAIRDAIGEKGHANVLFAAAPSQNELLAALCSDEEIDWSRVDAFHMDEYVGLPAEHPAGFGNFLRKAIFDRVCFHSVWLLDGNAADPEAEAERYAGLLREHPLDVCLCGVGENGHLAFNDPGEADFHDGKLVKIVTLDEVCRQQQVNDGCFESLEQVPHSALTVTIPGILAADRIFCVVPSATKANAVRQMLEGPVSEACPASVLRQHGEARVYLDADAGRCILEREE